MYELPEHFPIAVNAQGDGPETDPEKVAAVACWCGDPDCTKHEEYERL